MCTPCLRTNIYHIVLADVRHIRSLIRPYRRLLAQDHPALLAPSRNRIRHQLQHCANATGRRDWSIRAHTFLAPVNALEDRAASEDLTTARPFVQRGQHTIAEREPLSDGPTPSPEAIYAYILGLMNLRIAVELWSWNQEDVQDICMRNIGICLRGLHPPGHVELRH